MHAHARMHVNSAKRNSRGSRIGTSPASAPHSTCLPVHISTADKHFLERVSQYRFPLFHLSNLSCGLTRGTTFSALTHSCDRKVSPWEVPSAIPHARQFPSRTAEFPRYCLCYLMSAATAAGTTTSSLTPANSRSSQLIQLYRSVPQYRQYGTAPSPTLQRYRRA